MAAAISSACRRTSSAREPADGADGGRVVADRDVLIAALDGGAAHLLDARPSVGPRGVAMQVAANVHRAPPAPGARRGTAPRAAPGDTRASRARGRRRPRPARPAAARARRRTPARRSRARARSRSARGSAAMSSTATPSTVTPRARRASCSTTATIWGSAAKRASAAAGSGAAQTTASCSHESRQRRTSPAGSPSEGVRDARHELPGAIEQKPAPRARLGLAGERLEQSRLGLRPDPRHGLQPPGGRRLAQFLGRADAQRAARSRSSAWHSGRGSGRGRRDRARARARARPARRCRPSRRARAAAPRSRRRSRAARAPGRCATSSATGTGAARIVSAARR